MYPDPFVRHGCMGCEILHVSYYVLCSMRPSFENVLVPRNQLQPQSSRAAVPIAILVSTKSQLYVLLMLKK